MKRKTIWIAETSLGEVECSSKVEAIKVEGTLKMQEEVELLEPIFQKYFRITYSEYEYNDYIHYCVDCGKKLFEYERIWDDEHRDEKGDLTYFTDDRIRFLSGWRCADCDKRAEELFLKMANFGPRLISMRNMRDIPLHKCHNEGLKETYSIYKMVEFYDKNYKRKKKCRKEESKN